MLSPELKRSLDRAITDTRRRRHEFITLEHLLYALIDDPSAKQVLLGCGADIEALRHDLETFLDETMAQVPDEEDVRQTIAVGRVLQRAVLHVQGAGKPEVTGANLLVSLFAEDESFAVYLLLKQKIRRSDITLYISHGIGKNQKGAPKRAPGVETDDDNDAAPDDPLSAYCVDLLAKAAKGNIDTLVGRDDEVTRAVQILCRRRKNNPVLVGEPGVGKTAIVEGLALRIHEGKVPSALTDAKIYSLDMGSLLAGTKFRGQFEERVKAVVDAILEEENAILFIDEIHTVVGAGATSGGSMDASNLLKPKLNSGELRCIGATTFKEFKTSFEKDPALARRFQKLEVIEPSIEESIMILQGLKPLYEEHHTVEYTHAAIEQCVRLAHKHLRDRRLPDSAIDVLDETGAAIRLREDDLPSPDSNGDAPSAQGPASNENDASQTDDDAGDPSTEDEQATAKALKPSEAELEEQAKGEHATALVETGGPAEDDVAPVIIDVTDVETVIARMARIPAKTVSSDDKHVLRDLEEGLLQVVFGQDDAVSTAAAAIKRARAGLARADKPIGCFLFAGPTGVGKTELAKQLGRLMGMPFLRFDMSEYMEKHSVSRLIGAPPGYVGFDQGGLLTDAVSKSPHSVVLLDEIEKAHPDIFSVLLQIMDNATLTDTSGRKTDFRNVILIMTSNAGAFEMTTRKLGFGAGEESDTSGANKALERVFSPEFRNRLDKTITFAHLPQPVINLVADKMMRELEIQLAERDVRLTYTDAARDWIALEGYDKKFGARPMARAIDEHIKSKLIDELLFGALEHGGSVHVDLAKDGGVLTFEFEALEPA